jgi:hypothetical protein
MSDKDVTACSYCTRPAHSQIVANNQIYCGKLCAAMGLIAEVHGEDEIIFDTYEVCFQAMLDGYFQEGPIPIPLRVRYSDAAELDATAPDGFAFVVIPIDDEQGTPDWIPPGGKQLIVDQGEVDRVVDGLLRNGNEPGGRP